MDKRQMGMVRVVSGLAAEIDPGIDAFYLLPHADNGLVVMRLRYGPRAADILCIEEEPAPKRRDGTGDGGALWRTFGTDPAKLGVKGVAVFYGVAAEPGDVWEASGGNKNMWEYRRLEYADKIVRHPKWPNSYKEIDTLLTADNLRRFLVDLPLEDLRPFAADSRRNWG